MNKNISGLFIRFIELGIAVNIGFLCLLNKKYELTFLQDSFVRTSYI